MPANGKFDDDQWVAITDPQSQKKFFANPKTGECSWERPDGAGVKENDTDGEWWELYDETHKLPYYYNIRSCQTQWTPPINGLIIPLAAIQSSAIGKRVSIQISSASKAPHGSPEKQGAPWPQQESSNSMHGRLANGNGSAYLGASSSSGSGFDSNGPYINNSNNDNNSCGSVGSNLSNNVMGSESRNSASTNEYDISSVVDNYLIASPDISNGPLSSSSGNQFLSSSTPGSNQVFYPALSNPDSDRKAAPAAPATAPRPAAANIAAQAPARSLPAHPNGSTMTVGNGNTNSSSSSSSRSGSASGSSSSNSSNGGVNSMASSAGSSFLSSSPSTFVNPPTSLISSNRLRSESTGSNQSADLAQPQQPSRPLPPPQSDQLPPKPRLPGLPPKPGQFGGAITNANTNNGNSGSSSSNNFNNGFASGLSSSIAANANANASGTGSGRLEGSKSLGAINSPANASESGRQEGNTSVGSASSYDPKFTKLLPEWSQIFDAGSGRNYYVNTITRETTWSRSKACGFDETEGVINGITSRPGPPLPVSSPARSRPSPAVNTGNNSSTSATSATSSATSVPVPLGDKRNELHKSAPQVSGSAANGGGMTAVSPASKLDSSVPLPDKSNKAKSLDVKRLRNADISNPTLNAEAALSMSPYNADNYARPSLPPPSGKEKNTESALHALPRQLQADIGQFQIEGYAKLYFATHKRGFFRKKVPIEMLLAWSKESITLPLLANNLNNPKEAVKIFKLLIQCIMGDKGRRSGTDNGDIQYILEKGVMQGDLRDEIYVQLCKQLNHNPVDDSQFRGWELMASLAIAFPPSKSFESYLKNFIAAQSERKDLPEKIQTLIRHCVKKVDRICKVGPRGKTPTIAEIERAKEAPFSFSLFGEALEDILEYDRQVNADIELPRILPFLAESVLELNGRQTEGIFRVPGDADAVTELRLRLEKGRFDITGITDPNVPASLLKFWLRDLAEPLIPADYYSECIQFAENAKAAVGIVQKLPDINRKVVNYMVQFLQLIAEPVNQPITKMTVNNLAMVFAPNFVRCPSDNPQTIFENTKYEQAFLRNLILHLKTVVAR